ncbi:MAG: Glucose-6-phosphate 1-dehydrogenase, partial [uncultured Actinomycetospora sp.]
GRTRSTRPHRLRPVRGDRRPGQAPGAAVVLPSRAGGPAARGVAPDRQRAAQQDRRRVPRRRARRGRGVRRGQARRRAVGRVRGPAALRRRRLHPRRPGRAPRPRRGGPRRHRGRRPARALLRPAAPGVRRLHARDRGARARGGRAGGLREAVRHVDGGLQVARRGRARGARRVAGLPHRPLPRQGGDAGAAGAALRQRPVRQLVGPPPRGRRADRRARDPRRQRPRAVLRRHRRGARHAGDAPVPGRRRGGHGAARLARRRRRGRGPGRGRARVPAPGPRRGGPRAVRRLPRHRPRRGGLPHRDVRRRPAVDRQRALARGAVPAAHRQTHGPEPPEGQPGVPRPGGHPGARRGPAAPGQRAVLRPRWRRGAGAVDERQDPGRGDGAGHDVDPDPARRPVRGRPAAAVHAADPRRAHRRPRAVHPPRRAGGGLVGRRRGARRRPPPRALRARHLGPRRRAAPRRPRRLGAPRL